MLTKFPSLDNVFNPYKDYDPVNDVTVNAPTIRCRQLESYFMSRIGRAEYVLIAEAPGCNGAKFSGIAMTDERTLLGKKTSAPFAQGDVIDITAEQTSVIQKQLSNGAGMNEPTSTVLYNFLYMNNVDPRLVVTWNAFPFHPHKQGDLMSNRAPKLYEVEASQYIQREFFSLFSGLKVIAIGNYAKELMDEMNVECQRVRHPSYGGAKVFTDFLEATIQSTSKQSTLI